MSRKTKDTVDYFPHDSHARSGNTLKALRVAYRNDGYAFWYMLLEALSSADGHYIDCSNEQRWQTILGDFGVDQETGEGIMDLLCGMEAIDTTLWRRRRIIWCQNLVDNLSPVYTNRRRNLPLAPDKDGKPWDDPSKYCQVCGVLLEDVRADTKYCSDNCRQKAHRENVKSVTPDVTDKKITTPHNPITTSNNSITTGENPITTAQSKVEYSKGKESKENSSVSINNNNVLEKYSSIIGELSEEQEKELTLACSLFSAAWVYDAITEAYNRGRVDWRYIAGILENWRKYGKTTWQQGDKYSHQKYSDLVQK